MVIFALEFEFLGRNRAMNLHRFGFLCAAGAAALGLRAAPVWHTWLADPADGNELPSSVWRLSLVEDGKALLFGANRGTMLVVR